MPVLPHLGQLASGLFDSLVRPRGFIKMTSLAFQKLVRTGGSLFGGTRVSRISLDFVLDGQSLLTKLASAEDGKQYESLDLLTDGFMGCFVKGFESDNISKCEQLIDLLKPDTEEGRYLLYICPECGDIACGAYGAKIRRTENMFEWYDFAYENGYEPALKLPSLGPFIFSHTEYAAMLQSAVSEVSRTDM